MTVARPVVLLDGSQRLRDREPPGNGVQHNPKPVDPGWALKSACVPKSVTASACCISLSSLAPRQLPITVLLRLLFRQQGDIPNIFQT